MRPQVTGRPRTCGSVLLRGYEHDVRGYIQLTNSVRHGPLLPCDVSRISGQQRPLVQPANIPSILQALVGLKTG